MSEISSADLSPQQSNPGNVSLESQAIANPWLTDLTESLGCSEPLTFLSLLRQYPEPIALQILALVEKEQTQKYELRLKMLTNESLIEQKQAGDRRLGQILGFSLAVVALITGSLMAILGREMIAAIAGGILGLTGIISLYAIQLIQQPSYTSPTRVRSRGNTSE